MTANSIYDRAAQIDALVAEGRHREIIGGLWDEIGELQLAFLRAQGLLPEHDLLDVGCGCLRGGVRFAAYLDAGRYAGVDSNLSLLESGYGVELTQAGLAHKVARSDLLHSANFEFDRLGRRFDFAIAQSLFTHIDLNLIRLCLQNVARALKPGGKFYATYFEAPPHADATTRIERDEGIVTKSSEDPYHYTLADFAHAVRGLPLELRRIGEWGHPRGQYMLEFEASADAEEKTRRLDANAARALAPGERHYRAYVGPAERYDFMSATQFALLFAMGLRESDDVLDIGCGSLRLGRLLIPFLEAGRYCGVEPNRWLVRDGIERELGRDAVALKAPVFSDNADFDFSSFDRRFRYVIAQSIATHTGPDLLRRLFEGASRALADDGLFLFSYLRAAAAGEPAAGWHYPDCVSYAQTRVIAELEAAGLAARPLAWFHPAAVWMAAARDPARLPSPGDAVALIGRPLFLSADLG